MEEIKVYLTNRLNIVSEEIKVVSNRGSSMSNGMKLNRLRGIKKELIENLKIIETLIKKNEDNSSTE